MVLEVNRNDERLAFCDIILCPFPLYFSIQFLCVLVFSIVFHWYNSSCLVFFFFRAEFKSVVWKALSYLLVAVTIFASCMKAEDFSSANLCSYEVHFCCLFVAWISFYLTEGINELINLIPYFIIVTYGKT